MLLHAQGLAMSTFQVVLVPTIAGVTLNELFPSAVKKFTRVLPLIGVVLTTLLCASPVGQVSGVLKCALLPSLYTYRILLVLQPRSIHQIATRQVTSTVHTCSQCSAVNAPHIAFLVIQAPPQVHQAAAFLSASWHTSMQNSGHPATPSS